MRPRDVLLYFLAFLQPCTWQYFLRDDGMVAGISHLVVANPDCQHFALLRCRDAFCIGPLGPLSTSAFSLCCHRDRAVGAWPEHSAIACHSFRGLPAFRGHIRSCAPELRHGPVRILGRPTLHGLCAIRASHCCLDPRLHRTLFLATAETVLQMGGTNSVGGCGPVAAACHDRRAPWRGPGDPTRCTAAVAR